MSPSDSVKVPAFCPWCGGREIVVRSIGVRAWFEVICSADGCETIGMVAHDHVVLPSGKRAGAANGATP